MFRRDTREPARSASPIADPEIVPLSIVSSEETRERAQPLFDNSGRTIATCADSRDTPAISFREKEDRPTTTEDEPFTRRPTLDERTASRSTWTDPPSTSTPLVAYAIEAEAIAALPRTIRPPQAPGVAEPFDVNATGPRSDPRTVSPPWMTREAPAAKRTSTPGPISSDPVAGTNASPVTMYGVPLAVQEPTTSPET